MTWNTFSARNGTTHFMHTRRIITETAHHSMAFTHQIGDHFLSCVSDSKVSTSGISVSFGISNLTHSLPSLIWCSVESGIFTESPDIWQTKKICIEFRNLVSVNPSYHIIHRIQRDILSARLQLTLICRKHATLSESRKFTDAGANMVFFQQIARYIKSNMAEHELWYPIMYSTLDEI